jgi:hypothetical protein
MKIEKTFKVNSYEEVKMLLKPSRILCDKKPVPTFVGSEIWKKEK